MSLLRNSLGALGIGDRSTNPGFDEETRVFLQGRLRILTGALAVFTAVLLVAFVVANMVRAEGNPLSAIANVLVVFPNALVTLLAAFTASLFWLLRHRQLTSRALAVLDAVFHQALIFPVLALYANLHTFSFSGFPIVVPFLCFVILTRAVFVPSTARRTVGLSLSAPLGVLLIQLWHGASFAFPDQAYPNDHFVDMVAQNQLLLVGSVAVAAIASRVNLGLRRRSYDAQSLGQYEIAGRIGSGAMGEVYLARHALLKRPTAVKLLRPDITGEAILERFEQEVRQTSRLTHPNTVGIFDYGHTGEGVFYYAMEYLDGADLREIVKRDGPMPASRVIHVLSAACGALAEAHSKGIVHRDIKPANIMLCEQGGEYDVVKILDFGLVKNLRAYASATDGPLAADDDEKRIIGTPETMAPEAIREGGVSRLSDLYSLAVVGYFLLTGGPIFDVETVAEFIRHHQVAQPVPPSKRVSSVPADLEQIILRCLAKDPGQRPTGALVLRRMLSDCAAAGAWSNDDMRAWWKRWFAANPRTDLQNMAVDFRGGSGSFGSGEQSWSADRRAPDASFLSRLPEDIVRSRAQSDPEPGAETRWETKI